MAAPLLEIRNLRTWFRTPAGTVRAVDGVDLSVDAGQTVALVGESGCGKSMTALSVMGLVDPPGEVVAGSVIRFDGADLARSSEAELERIRGDELSMIFQEPMTSLNPVLRIGTQIEETVRIHRRLRAKPARRRALEMLERVGIPAGRIDDHPHQLSGGMRQRAMIAMALACEPKLLIADEPTTALDVTIQAEILDLLRNLQQDMGMALLLITHDLGVVAEMAEEIAVMYAGRIVERGRVADVFASPQHPYTEALQHSVPVLGMSHDRPLDAIRGIVPSALDWPSGCRFRTRCEFAFDRCAAEQPPLLPTPGSHAACWLCEAGARRTAGVGAVT